MNGRKFVIEHDYLYAVHTLATKFSVILEDDVERREGRNRRMQKRMHRVRTRANLLPLHHFFVFSRNNINNSNQIATISRAGGLPRSRPIVKSYVGGKLSAWRPIERNKKKRNRFFHDGHWKKLRLSGYINAIIAFNWFRCRRRLRHHHHCRDREITWSSRNEVIHRPIPSRIRFPGEYRDGISRRRNGSKRIFLRIRSIRIPVQLSILPFFHVDVT